MSDTAATLVPEAQKPPAVVPLIGNLSLFLAIAAIIIMLVSVNIEVIGRSLFNHATIWVTEVSTYLVVVVTFVAAAHVACRDGNVRVDLLLNRLSNDAQQEIKRGQLWFAAFVSLVVLWKLTGFWLENWESGARSWSLLTTPLWIPQLAMIVGMASLCLVLMGLGTRTQGMLVVCLAATVAAFALLLGGSVVELTLSPVQTVVIFGGLTAALATIGDRLASVITGLSLAMLQAIAFFLAQDATLTVKSSVLVGLLFALLLSGLPVVFCLFSIGIFAMVFWLPPVSLNFIGERSWEAVNTFELSAIPMFVLMGSILVHSNASTELFSATRIALGRIRGSMGHASILASGIFAAVSGSSLATAATMGRVAGPEMMDQGYRPHLAYGVLAAGGTLGILIPPSIAMIIYGPLAGVPVTELFMAGILPGILMILAFAVVVLIWTTIEPGAAPRGQKYSLFEKLHAMKAVIPFLTLMALVLGSLYAGIATPTEAGAVGVLGALIISFTRGTLSLSAFLKSCEEAVLTTSFLLLIAVGAATMSFALDFLSMPQALVSYVESLGLSDIWLFVAIVVLYLILGMFVEPISMVLITLPVILPVIAAAGWDPLWFGIVLVMLVEIGLITPPVGMILYVLAGVSEDRASLTQISIGTLPFVAAFLAMVFVFFAFPDLVTILPTVLR